MPVTSEGSACPIMREPMSLEEFFALDIVLAELVDGQPVFLSSPAVRHQRLLVQLLLALEARRPPSLMILPAPMDWVLWQVPRATVRQPDLLVVPADTVNDQRITAPPRLVVEIISPDSQERDLVAKRRDYSRAGCPTYWIAHPERHELVVLQLDGDEYRETARLEGDGRLLLAEPFPVELDGRRLFTQDVE